VNNKNVDVRQRILPFLGETPMLYPKELRQLAERAIQIAMKHGEEIRHRIEVPFE